MAEVMTTTASKTKSAKRIWKRSRVYAYFGSLTMTCCTIVKAWCSDFSEPWG
jgi:hypothetical protein